MNKQFWFPNILPHTSTKPEVILISPPTRNMEYPPASLAVLSADLLQAGVPHCILDANVLLKCYLLSREALTELINDELPRLAMMYSAHPEPLRRIAEIHLELKRMADGGKFDDVEETKLAFQSREYMEILSDCRALDRINAFQSVLRMLHTYTDLALTMRLLKYPYSWEGPLCQAMSSMIRQIMALNPSTVAITAMSPQRNAALLFSRILKDSLHCRIVVGGSDPSRFPQGYLQHGEHIDYVYSGRAGLTAVQLFSEAGPSSRERWDQGPAGQAQLVIAEDSTNPTIPEPMIFDSFPLTEYLVPVLPVATSRGCSWCQCDFCDHWHGSPGLITYDSEMVADQMKQLTQKHGICLFHLTDDELEPRQGTRVLGLLQTMLPSARILTYARPSRKVTKEVLETWFAGGVRIVEWGLESASSTLLRKMHKGTDVPHVRYLLEESAKIGIVSKLMMFHNHPLETDDDLRASLAFLSEILERRIVRPFFPIRTRLELRKNTLLYSQVLEHSLFRKVWKPSSGMETAALYADDTKAYGAKVAIINEFCNRASRVMRERLIPQTDDESLCLDLVISGLREHGESIPLNLM